MKPQEVRDAVERAFNSHITGGRLTIENWYSYAEALEEIIDQLLEDIEELDKQAD